MSSPDVQAELAAIAAADALLTPDRGAFELRLGQSACVMRGAFVGTGEPRVVYVQNLRVPEHLEGNGIGSRLVRAFFRYCDTVGVEMVDSEIQSPTALRIRARLMGEQALHFYEETTRGLKRPLACSLQEAIAVIEAASAAGGRLEPGQDLPDGQSFGIGVAVYMREICTEGWEDPIVVAAEHEDPSEVRRRRLLEDIGGL